MSILVINFLFVLSVASAVTIYNSRYQQRRYNPYSLNNQLYQTFQPSPLHSRFFLPGSLGFGSLFGLATTTNSGSSTNTGISGLFRNSSLSSLQFPRVQSCTTALTGSGFGSCLNLAECLLRNGFPAGICNFRLRTCCASTGSSSIPVASFTKTSQTTSPATFTILRTSSEFCQVRLDFQAFNIGEVDQEGICTDRFWTVAGQADTNVPILCGINDGQHVYLNFNGESPITMTVMSSNLRNDDWNIKATQIRCKDTENLAPSGCLQYFPEATGQVQSFNFRNIDSPTPLPEEPKTYQLSNLDYSVCIGSPSDTFTTITWSKGAGTTNYYFVMTSFIQIISESLAGTVEVSECGEECTTTSRSFDYVEILNGEFLFNGIEETSDRFCGLGFPDTVTSTVRPFRLGVVTNSNEGAFEGSVGFSLSYALTRR